MALQIIDDAIQAHGGAGVSQDFAARRELGRNPHPAPRRRAGRGPQPRDRPDRIFASTCRRRTRGERPVRPDRQGRDRHRLVARHRPGDRRGAGRAGRARSSSPAARRRPATRSPTRSTRKHGEGRAIVVPPTSRRKEALQHLVDETQAQFGRIDILVCNAASNPYYGPMAGISDEQFRKILDNNVIANHWLIRWSRRRCSSAARARSSSSRSIGGLTSSTVIGAYNISKAADFQLARNLAAEFGPQGRAGQLHRAGPGPTDFARALWENPDTLKRVTSVTRRCSGSASRTRSPAPPCSSPRAPPPS